ncbi:MAG: sigma-54-dependent transcriptional regulator [Pannonibacter sp.]
MLKGRRIALVEDDEIMGGSIYQRLKLEGAEVVWIKLAQRALGALRTPRAPIDLVVCDIHLPDGNGEELFSALCQTSSPPPFLFLTGQGSIDQAVRLLHRGAGDYITKPFDMTAFLNRLLILLRPRLSEAGPILELLGPSQAAQACELLVLKASGHDEPVLIRGAAGTGKARIAKAIHTRSDRRSAPFVHINLGRSANASDELQHGLQNVGEGTLFLNGISYLTADDQNCLMRWLDSKPDCRMLTACGSSEEDRLRATQLRSDLLAQIGQNEIPIPPLRDRPDDAVWLLHRLFGPLNTRQPSQLRGISELTDQAVRDYDWPGNGRELRARLIQGMSRATNDMLFPSDLFPERITDRDENRMMSLSEAREVAERNQIIAALERAGGQVTKAAQLLRVSRTTLWEKMQRLGL